MRSAGGKVLFLWGIVLRCCRGGEKHTQHPHNNPNLGRPTPRRIVHRFSLAATSVSTLLTLLLCAALWGDHLSLSSTSGNKNKKQCSGRACFLKIAQDWWSGQSRIGGIERSHYRPPPHNTRNIKPSTQHKQPPFTTWVSLFIWRTIIRICRCEAAHKSWLTLWQMESAKKRG